MLAIAVSAAVFALVLACGGCSSVSYVKLTKSDVIGAWEFPAGYWIALEPNGTAYIDPILYAGNDNIPLDGGRGVREGSLTGTWSLVADGQVNYVQYQIPGPSIPKRLISEFPVTQLANANLYGCMEGGHVTLFGQTDPDSICDSSGMMQRVSLKI